MISGDIDEIPKPDVISVMRTSSGYPDILALECPLSYYAFGYTADAWAALRIVRWRAGLDALEVRDSSPPCVLPNSCWHCSYCFPNISQVQHKLRTFSHTEYSHSPYTDPEHIVQHTRHGLDLFDRDQLYTAVAVVDAPAFVKASPEFQYMVNRTASLTAGYKDYNDFFSL